MSAKPIFKSAPAYQHPRGRLMAQGAAALSNAELLAIIFQTGNNCETAVRLAERILAQLDGLSGLAQANTADLQDINGLGNAKITQIIASLELGRRLTTPRLDEHPIIKSAADAARVIADLAPLPQENIRLILLDSAQRVIATPTIYIGTINLSLLRIAEIYREAIAHSSPAIILAHNHPSGDPTPSPEDIELTRALATAGQLLDIRFVDHIIIGRQGWLSLREQGFLS
ncbi:MAG: DNA repair protein RadC [Chloroflexota bacterium]